MSQSTIEKLKNKMAELESTVSIDEWKKTKGLEKRFKSLRKLLSKTRDDSENSLDCYSEVSLASE